MRAVVEGQEIPAEDIVLDLLRWEGERSRGSDQLGPQRKAALLLTLDATDLRSIGGKLRDAMEEYLREDEDFFERPHMEDVPRPGSAELFVREPIALKRFLSADSFWRRKTGEAIVATANPFRSGAARWFLEGFKRARLEGSSLVLDLTVRGY